MKNGSDEGIVLEDLFFILSECVHCIVGNGIGSIYLFLNKMSTKEGVSMEWMRGISGKENRGEE